MKSGTVNTLNKLMTSISFFSVTNQMIILNLRKKKLVTWTKRKRNIFLLKKDTPLKQYWTTASRFSLTSYLMKHTARKKQSAERVPHRITRGQDLSYSDLIIAWAIVISTFCSARAFRELPCSLRLSGQLSLTGDFCFL